MGTPDLIEPIVGWRQWDINLPPGPARGAPFRLWSPFVSTYWPPGEALRARCTSDPSSPHPEHACGIYALKKQFDLWQIAHNFLKNLRSSLRKEPNYFEGIVLVIGEVSLWGRVVVCQRGWRAEFAYPRRIFLVIPESWESESHLELHALARDFAAYGVPVEFKVVEVEVRMRPPRWDPLAPPHGAG
ncbi:MAG: hypothetical protein H0W21_03825 [Actinobacteria bacterium]|nr:hypothetical protein [Actinomycetota bacterium]